MYKRFLLAVLALGAVVAACTKKEEPKKSEAPVTTAPAAEAKAAPMKAAFVYVDPVGEAGWTYSHDLGRRTAEAKLAGKVVTSFVEKVAEGPDAERVIRDLATQGNKIIFGTSFGFGDSMAKVVQDFPEVHFEHATGFKTAPNLRVYDARIYEGAYLAGVVAGGMTKTNVLGFVGSFPIPEVLRNINAYTLGAQSVNPKVKTKVVWVSSWFDPPKETEAAMSLMDGGADVLLQNTDSTAVLQAAEKRGKFGFGWDSDMSSFAPKAHLGSCALNWAPYYEKAFNDVLDKTWKTEVTRWGVKEGVIDFVKVSDAVPAEVKKKLEDAKAYLVASPGAAFKGPLVDNAGNEVLPAGVVADDAWKAKVNFLVKGVEGKIPSGK
jgi:simple sugar transport system substrate-binding protein